MSKPFKLTDADIKAIRTAEGRLGNAAIRACVRDLFVLGLHLLLTGEKDAGVKACRSALRTLGLSATCKRRILSLSNLRGNEYTLCDAFHARAEFNSLIKRHQEK